MCADGSKQVNLSDLSMLPTNPAISPDGSRVAFVAEDLDKTANRIAVIPASGGSPTFLADVVGLTTIAWTPDGTAVAYARSENGIGNVWAQPLSGGTPSRITHFSEGFVKRFCWSADGKYLVLVHGRTTSDAVLFRGD